MAEWIEAAAGELARLDNPHREKKRATIIALVDARLAGRDEESIWKLPTTCARSTYHGKWKKDPVFADVLGKIYAAAMTWHDEKTVRALASASERLALASPVAVGRVIERLNSEDEGIILRAAFGILDRAGVETAPKNETAVTHSVNADQFAVLQMDAEIEAEAIDDEAEAGWSPDAGAPDDPGDQTQ